MKFTHYIMPFFLILNFVNPAHARWASADDLDIATESYNRDIYIHKEGTYVETIEFTVIATKESGKDKLVSFPLVYNAVSSELKVLEAKTILNGVEYPVDVKHIEDKPLASSPKGFDQNRQILIAFPEVALNAKIYLKYQMTVKEVPVPGFFSTDFIYGSDSYWQAGRVHVDSELPLYVEAHDKTNILQINQKQINHQYLLDIVLKKPIIKVALDEQYMGLNGTLFPWVTISTLQEWPKLGEMIQGGYEAVAHQKLPKLLEGIANEAKKKSTTIQKINTITARLSENITYMGDWRTIKGAYVPRALDEIVKTKIGDCKDFATATVAILRQLGIKSNVALVNRGMNIFKSPTHLPNLQAFNHAFVQVQEDNKFLWIDPTNFSSFAQGIYPDVAGRETLVLDPAGPILVQTKALDREDSKITFLKTVFLPKEASDMAEINCQISLSGIPALQLVGADLRFSKESINHSILSAVTDESRVVKWNMGGYNLTSRIASDLDFNFEFTEKNTQMKTTAGDAFLLPSHWQASRILVKTEDRVTDLLLDNPGTYHYETLLPKKTLVNSEGSACHMDSPWLQGSRKIANTPEGIQVLEELIVKKDRILNKELKSKEYAQFQNEVFSCFGDTALVYKH